ncbi:DUF86 domain-containing protein [candidate division WOR-3 bacterium]|nr:DUF86 domain-containing protein [candidate division WOR-3 bacterium]
MEDIYKNAGKILKYAQDKTYNEFTKDEMLIDAITRNLEIIGEAVKHIPKDVREKYNFIVWEEIAGLRDILIHEYFGINYRILWDIVKNEVPQLKEQMGIILKEKQNGGIK